MDALTVSSTAHFNRHLKRNDYEPIPPRYMKVLSMHLAGKPVRLICDETGYKSPTVYKILSDKRVVQMRQQILKHTQEEFEALYPKVVDNIRAALDHTDPDVNLKGSDMWLRANGKYKTDSTPTQLNVTAEDVVFNILNQSPQGE